MDRRREGLYIANFIYLATYGEKEGGGGGFTHIRVHLLRILWREGRGGGITHILGKIH